MRYFVALFLCVLVSMCVCGQTIRPLGPTGFCVGSSVILAVDPVVTNATFQWQLDGNNINSNGTGPSVLATVSGSYTVIVTQNGVPITYDAVVVTASQRPKAGFTSTPANQCSNVPVSFNNTSSGAGVSYTWNFGDPNSGTNNTSTVVSPVHKFIGLPGTGSQTFIVTLVANSTGCTDTIRSNVVTTQTPGLQLGGTGSVIYNGLPYFTQCTAQASLFTFTNQSSTSTTNTNYTIVWGDGQPDYVANSFSATTHTYNIGNYPLKFIVTGQNGCKDTGNYNVFVGNNPAVGLNNPGNTFICSQTSLTFPITGTDLNPPGTIYTVTFNDGSAPVVFNHPAPASVTHFFDKGSCGTTSGGFPNSFEARITASNPCGPSAAAVVPIYVSEKTKAIIGILPDSVVCATTNVTINNISGSGFGVTSNGVCIAGKGVWTITPATGWTLNSGTLGNDFGQTDPSLWTNGSASLNVRFTTPGNYSIKLKTGATALCGGDSTVRTICVNPAPVAAFTLSANQGCEPLTVTTTDNSTVPICNINTYQWTVTSVNPSGCTPTTGNGYTYTNGTSATSAAPQFLFTNPGVYTLSLVIKNSKGLCTSVPSVQTVTVKTKPTAVLTAPAAVCQNGSINPTVSVNNCYSTVTPTYAWSFAGGTPANSTTTNPGAITYSAPGTYAITLTVTNECGSTVVTRNISVNQAPDVITPADQLFCSGSQTKQIVFTGSIPGTTYNWTNSNPAIGLPASGAGSIPVFTAASNITAPVSAIITVTPLSGCTGAPQSFTVTVNPAPAVPTVVSPVIYCLNEPASPLSGTPSAGNSIMWYTSLPLVNGSSTAPIPSTATAGTTTYYATQSNSYSCESPRATVTVTVNPMITNNTISADQAICSGSTALPFAGPAIGGGSGVYSYQWQSSIDNGANWGNITGAVSATYNAGAVTATTQYRRVVSSVSCSDTSNKVTISVQGSLANIGISGAQTICAGSQPDTLRGQLPTSDNSTITYQWESSADNVNWSVIAGATTQDYIPPVLSVTTYYRRRVASGQCTVYSSAVQVAVNAKPVITPVTDKYLCNNSTTGIISFTGSPAGITYAWVNDNTQIGLASNGSGNIPSFTATNSTNPKVPVTATIMVVATNTANNVACPGDAVSFKINILPTITIGKIPDEVKCTGSIIDAVKLVPDSGALAGTSVQYNWTVAGSGITLTNGQGNAIPPYSTFNPGSTDLVTTITVTPKYTYLGNSCDGTPVSYTITTKSSTPGAGAGPDVALCNAATVTLSAAFVNGTTGVWSQDGTGAIIATPNSNITSVSGLQPNTIYKFVWTQSGFASCPPTTDEVIVDNRAALVNNIDTASTTICAGTVVNENGGLPTGGSGVYKYLWQQSADGINYTDIAGATTQNISITPATTAWLRRYVDAGPCNSFSFPLKITVQAAIANNIISANDTICTNTAAKTIMGSQPTGGNNIYNYLWEQSVNNGLAWAIIPGANAQNYSPGVLTQSTLFRRRVETSLCAGAFGNLSNVIIVVVSPDAKALFVPTDVVKCPPFVITPAIVNLQLSNANSQYTWYANGTQIGTGTTFPGYTIANGGDSVFIRLNTLSAFGCKNDDLTIKFSTPKTPSPSFTLSDTVGCGPLLVQATNTSTNINEFTYLWNFGNRQTSTLQQPPAIQFATNPNFGDTTYTISLKVFSICDTLTYTKTVRVKSKPKALFTPTMTTGCSPMTVNFRNTSRGSNNSYLWDFGDGTGLLTTSQDLVSHVYTTGVVDTFYAKLKVTNECGVDSLQYSIVVSPNSIKLNLAINGTDQYGCTPHAVAFINNSSGASVFRWDFGDGATTATTKNVDTVYHTYLLPGTFKVSLQAINNCSDTTTAQSITVYPVPDAAFTVNKFAICKGDTARFQNLSTAATSYLWQFGDGVTSSLNNPTHAYSTAGDYVVKLTAYRNNPSGNICTDTAFQPIQVAATLTGAFTASDTVGKCAPFTVTFVNQTRPSATALWNFGDNSTASGDSVIHTFQAAGVFNVTLTVTVSGGCTYITTRTINVLGPAGTLVYQGGFNCQQNPVRLQAVATGATSYLWNFGDGITQTTTQQIVFHNYVNPGLYIPTVTLQSGGGCDIIRKGTDTIKVDRIEGGFTIAQQKLCGASILTLTDTSHVFFGKSQFRWNFGDNTSGTGAIQTHSYSASGSYTIQMIVTSNSGCSDTTTRQVVIAVNNKPTVSITAPPTGCVAATTNFRAVIQSIDAISVTRWSASDGATGTGQTFNHIFNVPGNYTVQLIAGTVNGCFDTASYSIVVNPSPVVIATPSLSLCRGTTTQLNVTGAPSYQWTPLQGLSCYTCAAPVASPTSTTPYVVEGKNSFGCSGFDTVVITVIQPLRMNVPTGDSICIGQSTTLIASGASSYSWSPALGLNNTTISNPTASPSVTTVYRVVGYDGFNCFTDTAFVTVGVGQYPTVNLGPDLTLATGTLQPLTSTITNGPISRWLWSPATDLSCTTCALPVAEVKKPITYSVVATTPYGCSASDSISIKVFCDNTQVFIPNAFTPDGDGLNDILMVRSKGIVQVKYFRIFNRWGEMVFERSNFPPNDPVYGWNGMVKNQKLGPDVFAYTCEVMCENGTIFSYKGNVTIIK